MTARFTSCITMRYILAGLLVLAASGSKPLIASEASHPVLLRCAFDPGTGRPNPLEMRAFISLEQTAQLVRVSYTQLPASVANAADITVETTRSLVFAGRTIAEARAMLGASIDLYSELVGYRDEEGFLRLTRVWFASKSTLRPMPVRAR